MGILQRGRDLDARGSSILPASTETRSAYLERLAKSAGGLVEPALSALSQEVMDQRRTIASLEARLADLERRDR